MTSIVREPDWPDLLNRASNSYYKLILVVGPMGSGKTETLKRIGAYGLQYLNFGEELSRRLLPRPKSSRAAEAEEIAIELIREQKSHRIALDNTEIIFEAPLLLHPIALLKRLSIDRVLIASWNGHFDEKKLVYGAPGHPAYQEHAYNAQDTFIIVPTDKITTHEI